MFGAILFIIFQVETPSKILIDANREYSTRNEVVRERFGAYYGGSIFLETEPSKAYIFKYRWQAEYKAEQLREALRNGDYFFWVRVLREDENVSTHYEKQKMFIGGDLL